VVSFTLRLLYIRGKSPQYPLERKLGPRTGLNEVERTIILPIPGLELRYRGSTLAALWQRNTGFDNLVMQVATVQHFFSFILSSVFFCSRTSTPIRSMESNILDETHRVGFIFQHRKILDRSSKYRIRGRELFEI
jgi:hypothetical protein